MTLGMLVRRWLLGCSACLGVACGGASAGEPQSANMLLNPSGDCTASDDGSRAGYHSAAGTTWLPDCKNPLKREYWRVFAESKDSAYVIPRPDAAVSEICAAPAHELRELVQGYSLCAEQDAAFVERINRLRPEDALELTHYLHTTLRFDTVKTDAGDVTGITPYPLPSDIVDACAFEPSASSPELETMCQRERDRLESGHDIGFSYDGPGAAELAAKLNELYGIR